MNSNNAFILRILAAALSIAPISTSAIAQQSTASLQEQARQARAESEALWQDGWKLRARLHHFNSLVRDRLRAPTALERGIEEDENYIRNRQSGFSTLAGAMTLLTEPIHALHEGKLPSTRLKEVRTELAVLKDMQSGGQALIQMSARMKKMFELAAEAEKSADSLEAQARSAPSSTAR